MVRAKPFANYAQEVGLRCQKTNVDPLKRAPALILNIGPAAREVCMAAGSDEMMGPEGAMEIAQLRNNNFAPGAVDTPYQQKLRAFCNSKAQL